MVTVMTGSRGEPYEKALRMIRQIRDGRHESLSLVGMQLTALPPEIGELVHLKDLDLQNNQLCALLASAQRMSAF